MSDFNTSEVENFGGWSGIEIYATDQVQNCPDYLTNSNSNLVVFEATNDIVDFYPVGDEISIRENQRKNKIGNSYAINVDVQINNQSAEIEDYLNTYMNKKVLVVGIKMDGKRRLFGSVKFPLEFNYILQNSNEPENPHITSIVINGDIPQRPVYLA